MQPGKRETKTKGPFRSLACAQDADAKVGRQIVHDDIAAANAILAGPE